MLFKTARPTLRAVDAAGAARNLGAIYTAVACHHPCRSIEVASGATDAVRWAAEEGHASFHGCANENQTQILYTHARKSPSEPSERDRGVNRCTSEYEISRPNHQTYTEASIVVHLNAKRPSELSDILRGVNRFTPEYEKDRPNHQTYSEASIVVHLNMKKTVRTVRYGHRRQSCTRTHERTCPNRQIRTLASMVLHSRMR